MTDPMGWQRHHLASGTTVFHATTLVHAISIGQNGIQQVQNAWGGGRLGQGFYTHVAFDSAALYVQTLEVTLEFETTADMDGAVVPQNIDVSQQDGIDYLTGNDYLTPEEDEGMELKFHNGDNLQLVNVYVHDQDSVQGYTAEQWAQYASAAV